MSVIPQTSFNSKSVLARKIEGGVLNQETPDTDSCAIMSQWGLFDDLFFCFFCPDFCFMFCEPLA